MSNPFVPLEWLYETLNKRVNQGLKLQDLFLCVPFHEEAEFEFELTTYWSDNWRQQGNDINRDYPALARLLGHGKKSSTIRVFFIHPTRLAKPLILWHKKFPYPKVSKVSLAKSLKLID